MRLKLNADAFETPTLLYDEVRQRNMTVTGYEDICKPERLCSLKSIRRGTFIQCNWRSSGVM